MTSRGSRVVSDSLRPSRAQRDGSRRSPSRASPRTSGGPEQALTARHAYLRTSTDVLVAGFAQAGHPAAPSARKKEYLWLRTDQCRIQRKTYTETINGYISHGRLWYRNNCCIAPSTCIN